MSRLQKKIPTKKHNRKPYAGIEPALSSSEPEVIAITLIGLQLIVYGSPVDMLVTLGVAFLHLNLRNTDYSLILKPTIKVASNSHKKYN